MKSTRLAFAAVVALALPGTAISAQDLRFGGQITIAKPQSDFDTAMDGKLGYGLGVHAFLPFSNGHALVPRIDYLQCKRSGHAEFAATSIDWENKWTLLTVGADYNYFVSGKANHGFYLLGGLGYLSWKASVTATVIGADPVAPESFSTGTIYLDAGVGYAFTPNLGAELKYNHAKITVDGEEGKIPSIQASFVFRF